MPNIDKLEIAKFDADGMLEKILKFPQQLSHALELAKSRKVSLNNEIIQNICICGMGGSAIGGDLVRSCFNDYIDIPFSVNRYYRVPNFINENSLVIVCSYSGNTEETLAAYEDAHQRKAQIVCVTSGGLLSDKAALNNHPVFSVPSGYPPRSALGYLLVPILYCLFSTGKISDPEQGILETIEVLENLAAEYDPDENDNLPKQISRSLKGKIPLIYASVASFEPVTWRWKGQLSENSKVLAFGNVFPELNHNEIMGWGPLDEINKKFQVIYLTDRGDDFQAGRRMELTRKIVEKHTVDSIIEIKSQGESLLTRLFSLIFLGYMVSLYLAVENQVYTKLIENINFLKQGLLSA